MVNTIEISMNKVLYDDELQEIEKFGWIDKMRS